MNTKHTISILLFSILAMLTVSCQNDIDAPVMPEGCGGLNVRTVATVDESEIPIIQTKSFGMDVNTFIVEITNKESGKLVKKFDTYQEMLDGQRPMLILPVGEYVAKAYSCEPGNGVFDAPYFMSEQDFEIMDKTVTNVDKLICKFRSIAADIRTTDNFNYMFKDNYSITVENGLNGKVVFTKDTKGKVIYFDRIESLKLTVTVQPKDAAQAYPARTYYVKNGSKTPALGEYYIISFDGEKPTTKVSF